MGSPRHMATSDLLRHWKRSPDLNDDDLTLRIYVTETPSDRRISTTDLVYLSGAYSQTGISTYMHKVNQSRQLCTAFYSFPAQFFFSGDVLLLKVSHPFQSPPRHHSFVLRLLSMQCPRRFKI